MHYEDTGLPWVLPSPNMPTVDTAFVYPGGCLIEGTNLSEGRGTTRPFELVGAPWLDGAGPRPRAWRGSGLPGVRLPRRAPSPRPSRSTRSVLCHGVQVHVSDRERFPAFLTYLLLIHHARRQDPARFAWREPPYEYEHVKLPDRHPVRHRPGPEGDRGGRLAEAPRRAAGGRSEPRSGRAPARRTCSTERAIAPPALSLSPYLRFPRDEWAALRADTPAHPRRRGTSSASTA